LHSEELLDGQKDYEHVVSLVDVIIDHNNLLNEKQSKKSCRTKKSNGKPFFSLGGSASERILSIFVSMIIVLSGVASVSIVSSVDGPVVDSGIFVSVFPESVCVNGSLFVNVSVPSSLNVSSVVVDMGGFENINLYLSEDSGEEQIWNGLWAVPSFVGVGDYVAIVTLNGDNVSFASRAVWSVLVDEVIDDENYSDVTTNETNNQVNQSSGLIDENNNSGLPVNETGNESNNQTVEDENHSEIPTNETGNNTQVPSNQTTNETGEPSINETVAKYKLISVFDAKSMIDSGERVVVFDIRSIYDYEYRHIDGAIHVSSSDLNYSYSVNGTFFIYRNYSVIVYGKNNNDSLFGCKILLDNYFSKVFLLDGSINAWIDSGYPTTGKYNEIPDDLVEGFWLPVDEPGFITGDTYRINYPWAMKYFLNKTSWGLEALDGGSWADLSSLRIEYRNVSDNKKKLTLIFDANADSPTTSYRLNLSVDFVVENYVFDDANHVVSLTYSAFGRQFLFTFNYSDIAVLPGLVITKGVSDGKFWFSVRCDDVVRGTHMVLDPEYTISSGVYGFATYYNNGRKLVRLSNGTLYAFYLKSWSNKYNVNYSHSTDNGATWDGETRVTGYTTYDVDSVSVAASANGTYIHIVYNARQNNNGSWRLNYTRYSSTGLLSETSLAPTVNTNEFQGAPAIAVDSSGNIHVVWHGLNLTGLQYQQIRYRKYSSGSWGNVIYLTSGTYHQCYPSIAIDEKNYVHIAWNGTTSTSPTLPRIRYRLYDTAWNSIQDVTGGRRFYNYRPCIAVDSSENPHVVWYGNDSAGISQIRYNKRTTGSWGTPTNLTFDNPETQTYPSIAIDRNDYIHVVWQNASGNIYIRYKIYTTKWCTTYNLTSGAYRRYGPSLIWAIYPRLSGSSLNMPQTGYAFIFTNRSGTTYNLAFYSSSNLTWDTPPEASDPYPSDTLTGLCRTPICNVTVSDINGGTVTVKFYENTTGIWVLRQTNSSVSVSSAANVKWIDYAQATSLNTKYWWSVNVSDPTGGYDNNTYSFTTGPPFIVKTDTESSGLSMGYTNQRKLVKASNDTLYCVYDSDASSSAHNIRLAKSTDSGETWTYSYVDSSGTGAADDALFNPTLAIDSNNYLHVVYNGTTGGSTSKRLRYTYSTDGGSTWAAETELVVPTATYKHESAAIAVDSNDNLHVVWSGNHSGSTTRFQIRYKERWARNSTWSRIYNLTNEASSNRQQKSPSIAIDSGNNISVVWYGNNSASAYYQIRYKSYRNSTGSWSSITNISANKAYGQSYPSIAIDTSDNFYVIVWHGNHGGSIIANQIRYSSKSGFAGTWSQPKNITSGLTNQQNPSLSYESSNMYFYAFWYGYSSGVGSWLEIRYSISDAIFKSWSAPSNLTVSINDDYYPNLVWARYPYNTTDVPYVEYALIYAEGTTIKYYAGEDLDWYTFTNVTPYTWALGTVTLGSINTTAGPYFTIENIGGTMVDVTINATNATDAAGRQRWTIANSPGDNIFSLRYKKNGDTSWTNLSWSYVNFATYIDVGESKTFDLKFLHATDSDFFVALSVTITLRSVAS